MNMVVASLVCVALLAVSLAHFMWGFGRKWPVRDEAMLARTVIGTAGVSRMPPWYSSLGIAIVTLAAALLGLSLADPVSGGAVMTGFGILAALVFLARGAVGFTPAWRAKTPEEPFRSNDQRVYSPLCLGIGVGFAILVLLRFL